MSLSFPFLSFLLFKAISPNILFLRISHPPTSFSFLSFLYLKQFPPTPLVDPSESQWSSSHHSSRSCVNPPPGPGALVTSPPQAGFSLLALDFPLTFLHGSPCSWVPWLPLSQPAQFLSPACLKRFFVFPSRWIDLAGHKILGWRIIFLQNFEDISPLFPSQCF